MVPRPLQTPHVPCVLPNTNKAGSRLQTRFQSPTFPTAVMTLAVRVHHREPVSIHAHCKPLLRCPNCGFAIANACCSPLCLGRRWTFASMRGRTTSMSFAWGPSTLATRHAGAYIAFEKKGNVPDLHVGSPGHRPCVTSVCRHGRCIVLCAAWVSDDVGLGLIWVGQSTRCLHVTTPNPPIS